MDRSPTISTTSSEVKPLLQHDGDIVIDEELYAIGGAVGGSEEPVNKFPTDTVRDTQEPVYELPADTVTDAHEPAHEFQSDAVGDLEELFSGSQIDIDKIIQTLFFIWIDKRRGGRAKPVIENYDSIRPIFPKAVGKAWRYIKTRVDVPPKSEIIVRRLTEEFVNYRYLLRLTMPDKIKEVSKEHISKIVTESWQQILDDIHAEEERETILEEERLMKSRESDAVGDANESFSESLTDDQIIQFLFVVWIDKRRGRRAKPVIENYDFIRPIYKRAVGKAWRYIKARADVLPESEVIVRGLTKALVDYRHLVRLAMPDKIQEASEEDISKIVAENWQQILDEIHAEDERERIRKRERRKRFRERLQKHQEIAEVLWFYRPFATMELAEPVGCKECCITLCLCFSILLFQVPICTLLLAWSLSIGIMGGLYMTECPMSNLMTYMMIAIGVVGPLAILMRLSFVIYEKVSKEDMRSMFLWTVLKVLEFVLLVFLIIQLYLFYSRTPRFHVESPNYCDETFYNFVYWINFVSIGIASLWLFIYVIKLILTYLLRRYHLRPW